MYFKLTNTILKLNLLFILHLNIVSSSQRQCSPTVPFNCIAFFVLSAGPLLSRSLTTQLQCTHTHIQTATRLCPLSTASAATTAAATMCIEQGNLMEGPPLGNKKQQIGFVCVRVRVCLCVGCECASRSLARCRSLVCIFVTNVGAAVVAVLRLCYKILAKKNHTTFFLKLFSTIFHRYACAGVSVCRVQCSAVCMCVGLESLKRVV